MSDWLDRGDRLEREVATEGYGRGELQDWLDIHARELIDANKAVRAQSIRDGECWELLNVRDNDVDNLKALLRRVEWWEDVPGQHDQLKWCVSCREEIGDGHAPDCELAAATGGGS